jgi:AcrR family transcriptional regulator
MDTTRTLDPAVATRLLDAAEELFYARGIQAVGIDEVVRKAGVATKTLYAHFGSKDGLVQAYLQRRDRRWNDWLRGEVLAAPAGQGRVAAVFDALGRWFAQPDFNGCAFINVAGELATSPAARAAAAEHKTTLRALLAEVADGAGTADPAALADHLMLLVEGAIVTAHVEQDTAAAARAATAAAVLLDAATTRRPVHQA